MTDRPTLNMRPQLRTPDWIRQAKANDEQIRDAIAICEETLTLQHAQYDQLLDERHRLLGELADAFFGSHRIALNEMLCSVQNKILRLDRKMHETQGDRASLQRELRGDACMIVLQWALTIVFVVIFFWIRTELNAARGRAWRRWRRR